MSKLSDKISISAMREHLINAGWESGSPSGGYCDPDRWWHRIGVNSYTDLSTAFQNELGFPERVRQVLLNLEKGKPINAEDWPTNARPNPMPIPKPNPAPVHIFIEDSMVSRNLKLYGGSSSHIQLTDYTLTITLTRKD